MTVEGGLDDENVNKKFNFIGQPVNTDYLYDNFYSGYKDSCIYAYFISFHFHYIYLYWYCYLYL